MKKKQKSQFMKGVVAGTLTASGLHSIAQDSYGGREGYIRHLQALPSWQWLDSPWCWVFAAVLMSVGLAMAVWAGILEATDDG